MWLLSFLVHSSGTSRLPAGRICTEHASTSGMPEVVSGSSITVDPLDRIIFCMPSWVQMMPMKFVDVKSVPNMIGHSMCLQTIKDCVNGWLLIVKVQVIWPRASMSSPDAFVMCEVLFLPSVVHYLGTVLLARPYGGVGVARVHVIWGML